MGMRKRWSRLITVDGVRYRYHVAEDQFDGSGLNICVQRVEPAGQRLLSGFDKPMTYVEISPGHRLGTVQPHAVTPRVIRQLILKALEWGWDPSRTGLAPFRLAGQEVVTQLPEPDADGGNGEV